MNNTPVRRENRPFPLLRLLGAAAIPAIPSACLAAPVTILTDDLTTDSRLEADDNGNLGLTDIDGPGFFDVTEGGVEVSANLSETTGFDLAASVEDPNQEGIATVYFTANEEIDFTLSAPTFDPPDDLFSEFGAEINLWDENFNTIEFLSFLDHSERTGTLTAGETYVLQMRLVSSFLGGPGEMEASFTFDTQVIPLPSAAGMSCAGLCLLAVRRRR